LYSRQQENFASKQVEQTKSLPRTPVILHQSRN
jgi:hypothetical protein